MIFIGVTGGIGSGKSLVCSEFAKLNIPIFFADHVAQEITANDSSVRDAIRREFGDAIFDSEKQLKRKELAELVFQKPERLLLLNSIIHPVVFEYFAKWKEEILQTPLSQYALVEAALMFESGFFELMDYNIAVVADSKLRIDRVILRDNINELKVLERMRNQISPEELLELSDFVIQNNRTISELQKTISFFHTLFGNLKKRKDVE